MAAVTAVASVVGAGASIYSGYQANRSARRSARQQEKLAREQFKLATDEYIDQDAMLRDQEESSASSLQASAAASGIKTGAIEAPTRLAADEKLKIEGEISSLNKQMSKLNKPSTRIRVQTETDKGNSRWVSAANPDYEEQLKAYEESKAAIQTQIDEKNAALNPDLGLPEVTDSATAIQNEMAEQYTLQHKGLRRQYDSAKIGLDNQLFQARETRRQGAQAMTSGFLYGGASLLSGAASTYKTYKDNGGWFW